MKKTITALFLLICSISLNAQLYTPGGTVNLSANGNLGIGIKNPISDLEIASKIGGVLTLSTAGAAGTDKEPLQPAIDFRGWGNYRKVSLVATESTLDVYTSIFSILTSVGGGPNLLEERFRIHSNGYVGIGTKSPISDLEVASKIGGVLTLSTAGAVGTANEPLQPAIDFRGWGNYGKVRLVATESTSDTYTSTFSILTNVGGGPDLLEERFRIHSNGYVGIGTKNPLYELDVCGTIRANEIKVDLAGGCDFVFHSDYNLMDLKTLEEFIKTNQHLPEIASEKEMIDEGLNMKEFQMKLLQKVEELTLYIIDQNKSMEELQSTVKEQNKEIQALKESSKK